MIIGSNYTIRPAEINPIKFDDYRRVEPISESSANYKGRDNLLGHKDRVNSGYEGLEDRREGDNLDRLTLYGKDGNKREIYFGNNVDIAA